MKSLITFMVAVGSCLAIALVLSRPAKTEVVVKDGEPTADVIAGYQQWTRVNPEPKLVVSRIAMLCAAPTAVQREMEDSNPHLSKLVTVYVNDIGRAAMMEQQKPVFPQGSIIVKEKLATKESKEPELLTVMRKREAGYDSTRGDWEYMVFDGPGKVVQASGKLEKCQACHLLEKDTDYISRSYLPSDLRNKLK